MRPTSHAGLRFGGYLADIPQPHVRMFPGRKRREVRVSVVKYYHHWYCRLTEEDNPIWDSKTGYWTGAWDDELYRGRTIQNAQHSSSTLAILWLENAIAEEFPKGTHVIVDRDTRARVRDFNYLFRGDADPDYVVEGRRAIQREGD
jgi:hypothetical protein